MAQSPRSRSPRLLGLPVAALSASGTSITETLDPHRVSALPDLAQLDPEQQTRELARWAQRADGSPRQHAGVVEAWRTVLGSRGRIRVATLAERVGYSERHLRAMMRAELGIGPKTALRVTRVTHAVSRLVSRADRTLADTAAACGYSDHALLATSEFTAVVGCSPTQWLAEEHRNIQAGGQGYEQD